jgi:hypothetical protein
LNLLAPLLLSLSLWLPLNLLIPAPWHGTYYSPHQHAGTALAARILFVFAFLPAHIVLGLWCGLRCRRPAAAFGLAMAMWVLWTVLPMLPLIVTELISYDGFETWWPVSVFSPLVALAVVLDEPGEARWGVCGLLIPVWIVALQTLSARFDRLVGRR